jgi:predicted metalloprotease with PDZ domain
MAAPSPAVAAEWRPEEQLALIHRDPEGRLGCGFEYIEASGQVLVTSAPASGPAAAAGLVAGDVLVSIGGVALAGQGVARLDEVAATIARGLMMMMMI